MGYDIIDVNESELQSSVYIQYLFDIFYMNMGLQALIDKARDILERPLLIHDISFRVIAFSYDAKLVVNLTASDDGNYYLDKELIHFIHSNNIANRIRKKNLSDFIEKPDSENGRFISIIKVIGVEVAHLVIHENNKPFTKTDILFIEKFSKLLSLELQKESQFTTDRDLIPSYILSDALAGTVVDEALIRHKCHYLSWIEAKDLWLMFMTSRSLEALDSKIPSLVKALKAFIPINHCMIYKSNLIAFLDESLFKQIFINRKIEFEEFLEANDLRVGISLKFQKLSESKRYYNQAIKAAELAHNEGKWVLLFENCVLYIVSELILTHYKIEDLCHPAVLQLLNMDKVSNSDLLSTLKYYIYYVNDPNHAAKLLSIHRNTLFYRINKIKEITGITLDNANEICRIYISIRFLEINNMIYKSNE